MLTRSWKSPVAFSVLACALSAAAPVPALAMARAGAARAAGLGPGAGTRLVKDLRAAWQITQGRGVTVAVIADGVDSHAAGLAGKVIQGPTYGKPNGSLATGTVFASGVAGAGPAAANPSGTLGLAPAVKILSIRVPQQGQAGVWERDTGKAIRYAVRHRADVIYVNSVGYGTTLDLDSAVAYAASKNAVVIAGEYKWGKGGNSAEYPDSLPGVLGAGTVFLPGWKEPVKAVAGPANESILVSAPGDVLAVSGPAGQPYEMFNYLSAAAWLTATVALVKSVYPHLPVSGVDRALAVSARGGPHGGYDTKVGFGLIDPVGALRAAAHLATLSESAAPGPGSAAPSRRLSGGNPPAAVNAVHHAPAVLAAEGGAAGAGLLLIALALALLARGRRYRRAQR